MLRRVSDLQGYTVQATDSLIGRVDDFYFDDEKWTIRHLVVETGTWVHHRKVLLSPLALGQASRERRTLTVGLSAEKIKNSPLIDLDRPISRQREAEHHAYYGWPPYWGPSGVLWGSPGLLMPLSAPEPERSRPDTPERAPDDCHLRSTREVIGYHLHSTDGDLGHVDDFVVDDDRWVIRYMVVDTTNWWVENKVLVAPEWITTVRWAERRASVGLPRETIRKSPVWNGQLPISREYEAQLTAYYGRPLHSVEPGPFRSGRSSHG
jgi:sporulation protein YlmC with PRC-barrel domain